ncbi:hypothetical protein [Micromonospora sp. SL4-19]|uniref:hypothetical protein n=1 Tax=Micromonospora sp. SL4-19 TaxID=3399129 RepID=UPI003A4E52DB
MRRLRLAAAVAAVLVAALAGCGRGRTEYASLRHPFRGATLLRSHHQRLLTSRPPPHEVFR